MILEWIARSETNRLLPLAAVLYAIVNALGLYLMKSSIPMHPTESLGRMLSKAIAQSNFFLGFLLYAGGFVIFIYTLSRGLLSVTLPIFVAAGTVGTLIVGVVFLNEPFSWRIAFGIALICCGTILVYR